jgi:hypothetical protein
VLLGERNLAQQTLEIVIFGYDTPQEAEAALRRQMEDLIRCDRTPVEKAGLAPTQAVGLFPRPVEIKVSANLSASSFLY